MPFNDTTLGGNGRSFPTTKWSQVLAAQDPSRPDYRDRLDSLVRSYWKPAYAYIRVAWRKSNEDAKDLTQAFFTRLLHSGRIGAVPSERARFRSYLKQALTHFLIDAERAADVRRPVEPVIRFETDPEVDPPAAGESPDQAYDREWASCLLDASLAKLEAELKAAGKEAYFNVFRSYLLEPAAGESVSVGPLVLPTYASVGRKWGVGESDVRNYLAYCRVRFRELLKVEIRDTVEDERDVEEELRSLLNG